MSAALVDALVLEMMVDGGATPVTSVLLGLLMDVLGTNSIFSSLWLALGTSMVLAWPIGALVAELIVEGDIAPVTSAVLDLLVAVLVTELVSSSL